MFERYTEQARRTIFFGRYEASAFGSPYIETEHLLLGLLREDKALAKRFFRADGVVDALRKEIEDHATRGEAVSTSVDLPLSHECKRVLAYGAEEAERLHHKHIGTVHLLVGLLREEGCFAAQLLRERGLTLSSAREQARRSSMGAAPGESAAFGRLDEWLAEREARGGVRILREHRVGDTTTRFAVYAARPAEEGDQGEDMAAAEKLSEIQKRIDSIVRKMEHAIAAHEFEKARVYSEEERKERENLRVLRERLDREGPRPRAPLLCIDVLRDESLDEVQDRCDGYLREGVRQVWLLTGDSRRAYTATKEDGLREHRGGILRIPELPLELDPKAIFE